MNTNNLETIKEFIKEFFQKASFEVEVETEKVGDDFFSVNINTNEPQILIGEGGQTLLVIQYLLKIILKRKFPFLINKEDEKKQQSLYFNLDINHYKQKKYQYLEELAITTADEVALMKKEKELPAMPAYQRRMIHLTLSKRSDVVAKSVGEEPNRRVIISPRVII
ncbi:MAG: protein jag [Minisyncoccales bacterium]